MPIDLKTCKQRKANSHYFDDERCAGCDKILSTHKRCVHCNMPCCQQSGEAIYIPNIGEFVCMDCVREHIERAYPGQSQAFSDGMGFAQGDLDLNLEK